jgi:hypothetical protein
VAENHIFGFPHNAQHINLCPKPLVIVQGFKCWHERQKDFICKRRLRLLLQMKLHSESVSHILPPSPNFAKVLQNGTHFQISRTEDD